MRSISIIGNGFVGNAIYEGLKKHFDILIYDNDPDRCTHTMEQVNKTDFIFLCVPTPMTEEGEFDLSIIKSAVLTLEDKKVIIIKSTITPRAATELIENFPNQNFVFNPEFLTERTAVYDFQHPSRIILGGDKLAVDKVELLYRLVFPSRLIEIIKTDYKTACYIKYFCNCFYASKVALMNEFRQVAVEEGVEWNTAIRGLMSSGWVNPMHTAVPGPDGDLGFGGKCFPKDINAFIKYAETLGIDSLMLKAAWNKNLEVRKNKNWLHIDGAVSKDNRRKK